MPILAGAIIGALIQVLTSLVGRILVALAISYTTYSGVTALVSHLKDVFVQNAISAGAVATGVLHTLQLDGAFGLIVGAAVAKLTLRGLTAAGTIIRMKIK